MPAHDEEGAIVGCIKAVRASLASVGRARAAACWIVVVADRCSDGTANLARAALGPAGEVIEIEAGNVGQARRLGTERFLHRSTGADPQRTWILTTDADTVAPTAWASSHLDLAEAGAAAVAGIVHVDSFVGHPPHVQPRHVSAYVLNADGTHGHVHGANLGVRADAYRAVNGWAPLRTGEDHDLWNRLRSGGWPVVSSSAAWVTTSGRAIGRAPLGFAWRLGTYRDDPVIALPAPRP